MRPASDLRNVDDRKDLRRRAETEDQVDEDQ